MTPFFDVLRVVNVLPHVQVTVVSTYSGWMSVFTAAPRLAVAGSRRAAGEPEPCLVQCARDGTPGWGPAFHDQRHRKTLERPAMALAGVGSVLGAVVRGGLLHLEQEVVVALRLLHPVEEQLEGLLDVQRVKDPAQTPDDLQLVRRQQDLLLAGAGGIDVDGREDPLVRELAVELELHVAGALELLEDDPAHRGAGLDQRRRDDGQRPTVLDVAGGAEE